MQILAGAEDPVQHAAYRAQRHMAAVQRRQRSSLEGGRLGEKNPRSLAVSRGARKQVLDLIERKTAILQLGRTAFRDRIPRRGDIAQGREPLVVSPDVRELSTFCDDIVVP